LNTLLLLAAGAQENMLAQAAVLEVCVMEAQRLL